MEQEHPLIDESPLYETEACEICQRRARLRLAYDTPPPSGSRGPARAVQLFYCLDHRDRAYRRERGILRTHPHLGAS